MREITYPLRMNIFLASWPRKRSEADDYNPNYHKKNIPDFLNCLPIFDTHDHESQCSQYYEMETNRGGKSEEEMLGSFDIMISIKLLVACFRLGGKKKITHSS